ILLVTLTQMSRIILIVLIVPFVSGLFQPVSDLTADPVEVNYLTEIFSLPLLIIPIAAVVLIYLLNKINFPAGLMLGPVIFLIVPFVSGLCQPLSDLTAYPVEFNYLTEIFSLPLLIIPIAAVVLIYLLNKINFPASLMLGPIIVLIVWNLTTGVEFSLDLQFINAAQILFGIRIGLQIASLMTQLNKRLIFSIMLQNLILIFGTMFIVYMFQLFTSHQFNDLFLSAAPGGLGQIIVIAIETGGNIAMISSYHIFRIFFI